MESHGHKTERGTNDQMPHLLKNPGRISPAWTASWVYHIVITQVQGSRFTVNPDSIAIFFMFPERHSVLLGLWMQNRLAYQKTG